MGKSKQVSYQKNPLICSPWPQKKLCTCPLHSENSLDECLISEPSSESAHTTGIGKNSKQNWWKVRGHKNRRDKRQKLSEDYLCGAPQASVITGEVNVFRHKLTCPEVDPQVNTCEWVKVPSSTSLKRDKGNSSTL